MVYLIHFDTKFYHCQHYIGYSDDFLFAARIRHHMNGSGAALIRAVNLAGIGWSVVRLWPYESGNFERQLKNIKKASSFCPICNPQHKQHLCKKKKLRKEPSSAST